MKRFLAISLALASLATDAWCCGGEYNNHNNYLFSVFRREMMDGVAGTSTDQFWKTYTGGEVEEYRWGKETVLAVAQKKGDREMVEYVTQLNRYLDICGELRETWSYPTKEELQQRKADLATMQQKATAYSGTRLSGQWALLRMRSNMLQGNHAANVAFWEQKASKMASSPYRTMMEDIYAGALLHTGRQLDAFNIYTRLGDMTSIKWAMRKYRNLAGIQRIYSEDPNSPCMTFLVQDFVNNAQETLDTSNTEWLKEIDCSEIKRQEGLRFIEYARKVVSSGKSSTPALWQAAIGELQYLYGDYAKAYATLDKAVGMAGTERMRDNARAIRLVASVPSHKLDDSYQDWLAGEIRWLIGKMNAETTPHADNSYITPSYNHYYDVLDRLVHKELAPKYRACGQTSMATALVAMVENLNSLFNIAVSDDDEGGWNPNYSGGLFDALDQMSAAEAIDYASFLRASSTSKMEQLVKKHVKYDADYYNDIIGTKLLAEGQFAEAIDYLQRVPLSFMEAQNISYYLANRRWDVPKWVTNQRKSFIDTYTDGPHQGKLSVNPKVKFCQEMVDLKSRYEKSKKEERRKLAYQLANRYYQASHLGDCWYLTQYHSSVRDSVPPGHPDFAKTAMVYLHESKLSSDLLLSESSYYGLAFIPIDEWRTEEWSDAASKYVFVVQPTSRQYNALAELSRFVSEHKGRLSGYVTKCDVLNEFRKQEGV